MTEWKNAHAQFVLIERQMAQRRTIAYELQLFFKSIDIVGCMAACWRAILKFCSSCPAGVLVTWPVVEIASALAECPKKVHRKTFLRNTPSVAHVYYANSSICIYLLKRLMKNEQAFTLGIQPPSSWKDRISTSERKSYVKCSFSSPHPLSFSHEASCSAGPCGRCSVQQLQLHRERSRRTPQQEEVLRYKYWRRK